MATPLAADRTSKRDRPGSWARADRPSGYLQAGGRLLSETQAIEIPAVSYGMAMLLTSELVANAVEHAGTEFELVIDDRDVAPGTCPEPTAARGFSQACPVLSSAAGRMMSRRRGRLGCTRARRGRGGERFVRAVSRLRDVD